MSTTLRSKIIDSMIQDGYTLIDQTSGRYSSAPQSNLQRALRCHGLVEGENCIVRLGKKIYQYMGGKRYKFIGYEFFIFVR